MVDLLVIDDDAVLVPAQALGAFQSPEYSVEVTACGGDGIERVRRRRPDVVLLDVRLPDASGVEVFEAIRAIDARIPVIFITTAKNADTAIEAMKLGAFDYLYKPLDLARLRGVVGQAVEVVKLREPVAIEAAGDDRAQAGTGVLVATSQPMLEIFKAVGRVAAQDVTVLITGESGTGKELVARAIYQHSARAHAPFLALNCAAIPENLLESELFGHERGAFTGADKRRIGKFEQCNGGTLLLDEIGDMPVALQAKMLRVLQERTFERVGGNETIHTDVRVIAATHRDLRAHESFRPDLYYRLSVFTIDLPPLRERGAGDIAALVTHYVREFSAELGREVTQVAPDAMRQLADYTWPGNIRELQSVLRQALLRASGRMLLPAFLPPLAAAQPAAPGAAAFDVVEFIQHRLVPGESDLHGTTHREVDRLLIAHTLEFTHGNHRDAAKVLGISRQTLRMRMRALGLYVEPHVGCDAG